MGVGRAQMRLGALVLVLWAAGCSEEDGEDMGEGLTSILLFFLLVALLIIALVVVLVIVGVSFLGKGVSKMTRRTRPPIGPWWDPAAQVWRSPDGSVFDPVSQQWLPPPPGMPPPVSPDAGGAVDEGDRTGGAVLIGIGGTVITLVAAGIVDGPARSVVAIAGFGLTGLLIHQLWQRSGPR